MQIAYCQFAEDLKISGQAKIYFIQGLWKDLIKMIRVCFKQLQTGLILVSAIHLLMIRNLSERKEYSLNRQRREDCMSEACAAQLEQNQNKTKGSQEHYSSVAEHLPTKSRGNWPSVNKVMNDKIQIISTENKGMIRLKGYKKVEERKDWTQE